jgi:hypothetical protein
MSFPHPDKFKEHIDRLFPNDDPRSARTREVLLGNQPIIERDWNALCRWSNPWVNGFPMGFSSMICFISACVLGYYISLPYSAFINGHWAHYFQGFLRWAFLCLLFRIIVDSIRGCYKDRVPGWLIALYWLPVALILALAGLIFIGWTPKSVLRLAIVNGLLVALYYAFLLDQYNALVGWGQRIFWNARVRKSPIAHLLYWLSDTLSEVKSMDAEWKSPEKRNSLIPKLEDAAGCVELLPLAFAMRDPGLRRWNTLVYKKRAEGIRELRKWILIPKPDTRQSLEQALGQLLDLGVVENWDGFPVAEPDSNPALPWWRVAVGKIGSLGMIAIPPVFLYLWSQSDLLPPNLRLPHESVASVLPFIVGWIIVGVLSLVDPRLGEKLELYKKATEGVKALGPDKVKVE